MSHSPYFTLTDSQSDLLGSPFLSSPESLQSPYPSQTFLAQGLQVDSLWHEPLLEADVFRFEPELEGVPPHLLHGGTVGHLSTYDSHTPSFDMIPNYFPFDDGITSSLPTSPIVLPPFIWSTCICGCGEGPCIRQRPYRRPKGDPLDDARVGELITFKVHGRCGMPLGSALRGIYSGLSGRDSPMFVGSRTSISIRLEFPNCLPWAQQMRTKDWRRKPSPITKAKLATEVAKKVDRFLKDVRPDLQNPQSPHPPGPVNINQLALVALEHVSMASWQPHIRII